MVQAPESASAGTTKEGGIFETHTENLEESHLWMSCLFRPCTANLLVASIPTKCDEPCTLSENMSAWRAMRQFKSLRPASRLIDVA